MTRAGGRRLSILIAVLAAAAFLAPLGGASRSTTSWPTLYVHYAMNCTFNIVDDNGNPVTQIPPGTYEVEVTTPIMFKLVDVQYLAAGDMTGCKGWAQFQMTGPGVSLATTLDTGCDSAYILPTATFQPSSTYTAVDLNQPSVTRTTFTTAATGSPAVPTANPYDNGTGKGTPSVDYMASGAALAGTLSGTLNSAGKLSLTLKGKPVTSLPAGWYKFAILDQDRKGSFVVRSSKGKPKDLTGGVFVGRQSVNVKLTPGQWTYYTGTGHPVSFRVTSS
jgi:hypothetical protein